MVQHLNDKLRGKLLDADGCTALEKLKPLFRTGEGTTTAVGSMLTERQAASIADVFCSPMNGNM